MRFNYYANPKMMGVYPFGGPITGDTPVTLSVTGLRQKEICDLRVRLSTVEIIPAANGDQLTFRAPAVTYPGTTVVQVTYNGQQYQSERVVHWKDPLSSYEYYVNPTMTYHTPN
jgi:IPT/TIG domain